MPIENRSSYTEMASVPTLLAADNDRDMLEYLAEAVETQTYVCDHCAHEEPLSTFDIASDLREYMLAFPQAPAPQPHPEPIAWMVGTAFWWTKEEAERDAAATGLTVVPVGPMAAQHGEPAWFMTEGGVSALHAKAKAISDQQGLDTSAYSVPLYTHADPVEVERLRAELVEWKERCQSNSDEAMSWMAKHDTLRAQLAERDAQLRMQDALLEEAYQHDIGTPLKRKIRAAALSASAEPEAT